MLLYKKIDVLDFVYSEDPVQILGSYNEITFTPNLKKDVLLSVQRDRDDEDDEEERQIYLEHPSTDFELKEMFKDLRVFF
jgi:hypothetical protein